jgi:hypothetical protein
VSYADLGGYPSPLDSDFFDLLQRLTPRTKDRAAVDLVLKQVRTLSFDVRRSMERAFYTLHLGAYLAEKLNAKSKGALTDDEIVGAFARCVQALLRKSHGKQVCNNHIEVLNNLARGDVVLSFNYDLVAERALRHLVETSKPKSEFGPWVYGFEKAPISFDLPVMLKLHGSSNWRISGDTIIVRTKRWKDFDVFPGYLGHRGVGTTFPIFLPFWEKRIEKIPWLPLWQRALLELQHVANIVVWGYSLPATDVKTQHLFTLGLGSRQYRLCVIDPSTETRQRWRFLFPDAQYWEYLHVQDFLSHPPSWWSGSKTH